jgi:Arc/MetJ-type ribon-helix-helix transcriptional regulator
MRGLSGRCARTTNHVALPRALERLASEAVAGGRYRDFSDAVAAGVSLLQSREPRELLASVLAVDDASDGNLYLISNKLVERVRGTIARKART